MQLKNEQIREARHDAEVIRNPPEFRQFVQNLNQMQDSVNALDQMSKEKW